jgi:hypothetical protein
MGHPCKSTTLSKTGSRALPPGPTRQMLASPGAGPDRSACLHPEPLTSLARLSALARARALSLESDLVC